MADGAPLYFLDPDKKQNVVSATTLLYPDFLAFSPDGVTLAVAEGMNRFTWGNKRIKTINLESYKENPLTEWKTASLSPAWSPDGLLLAFVTGPDFGPDSLAEDDLLTGTAKRRAWIMKADGSEKRQLTGDAGYREECPMWLADGKHLLFARFDEQNRPSLWLVQVDGQSPLKITGALSAFLTQYEDLDYYGYLHKEKLFDLSIDSSVK